MAGDRAVVSEGASPDLVPAPARSSFPGGVQPVRSLDPVVRIADGLILESQGRGTEWLTEAMEEFSDVLADPGKRGRVFEAAEAVDLLVEGEVEAVERAFGVAGARLLVPSGEQPVLASLELVGDECGDEVDRDHLLGLRLLQARFEDIGHAGEAELAQRLVEFDEIHDGSPVLRSMRSR